MKLNYKSMSDDVHYKNNWPDENTQCKNCKSFQEEKGQTACVPDNMSFTEALAKYGEVDPKAHCDNFEPRTIGGFFTGYIISESLKNPVILNKFDCISVKVSLEKDCKEAPIWHVFKVRIKAKDIQEQCKKIADELKYGWYVHFWNNEQVYVIFENKVFNIPNEGNGKWQSKEFQEMKEYGVKHGVEEKYLTSLDTK